MIKQMIEYTDFNGEEQVLEAYFNLTKAELIELEVSEGDSLVATIERVVEEKDNREIVRIFKKLILQAYGEKSEDGQRFIKNERLSQAFSQTEAYSELFMLLAGDADAASAFVNGILPKVDATGHPINKPPQK